MRQFMLGGVIIAGMVICAPAFAYDNFLPLGLGYSTKNVGLSHLSQHDLKIIGQADLYETEIYRRQLQGRQYDSRIMRIRNERNFDPTDNTPNY